MFEKIQSRTSLDADDKRKFANYIVLLMRRTPKQREQARDWVEENSETYFKELEGFLKARQSESTLEDAAKIKIFLSKVNDIRTNRRVCPADVWNRMLSPELYPRARRAIETMKWLFFIHEDRVFLTSDNPVFYFENLGLGNKRSELSLPVSSNIALLAAWDIKSERIVNANDRQIRNLNSRTVASATKYIYSHQPCAAEIHSLKKGMYQISKLVRR